MTESNSEIYLRLQAEHKILEQQMQELAWQIMSDDLKQIMFDKNGPYSEEEKNSATLWLIRPNRGLGYRCPIELILNGERKEITRLLIQIMHGVYI